MSKNDMSDLEFLQFLQALADHAEAENDDQEDIVEEADVVEEQQEQPAAQPKPAKSNKGGLHICSVKEAEFLVDTRMHYGRTQLGTQVVDYITDEANHVYGDADEYHNLISSYLRLGDYYNALRICEYALKKFPYGVDILANAIRAASDSGKPEVVDQYMERALKIDKKYWNWRLFLFALDAYQCKLSQCAPYEMDRYFEEAMALAKDYQTYIPLDERGYNKEAELLLMANKVTEARDLLTDKFDRGVEVDGERKPLVAPQCCVTMLNKILEDTHDYDEIIDISRRGIQDTAQEQPSSRIGYFMYRMALAQDARAVSHNFKIPYEIEEALKTYQCAYTLNAERTSYMRTIEIRYNILAQHVQNPGQLKPLSKKGITDLLKEDDE